MRSLGILESVCRVKSGEGFWYDAVQVGNRSGYVDTVHFSAGDSSIVDVSKTERGLAKIVQKNTKECDGLWLVRFNSQDVVSGKNWVKRGSVYVGRNTSKNVRRLVSGRSGNDVNSLLADDIILSIKSQAIVVVSKVSGKVDNYLFKDGKATMFDPARRLDIADELGVSIIENRRIDIHSLQPAHTCRKLK